VLEVLNVLEVLQGTAFPSSTSSPLSTSSTYLFTHPSRRAVSESATIFQPPLVFSS
jgi:hypothetical protein